MSDSVNIDIRGLGFSYGEQQVLKGLDLTIRGGEILALVGDNGSGKTTLSKLILGLLLPEIGEIKITRGLESHPVCDGPSGEVYYVFQNPENQIVGTTVLDDIAFGPENQNLTRDVVLQRCSEAIHASGLDGLENRNPQMLSGGQKQRLAIAGALAVQARFIIMDEPTAMLDPRGRTSIFELLKNLCTRGLGILLVTHLGEEILECNRIAHLREGKVTIHQSPLEFYRLVREESLDIEIPSKLIIEEFGS